MTTREVQIWPADPWVDVESRFGKVRQQLERHWYKNRPKAKPIRQQPSQEYKDNGFRTDTELAEAEVREFLELSIGISNWSVAS